MSYQETGVSLDEVTQLFQQFANNVGGRYFSEAGLCDRELEAMDSDFSRWFTKLASGDEPNESRPASEAKTRWKLKEYVKTVCVDRRYRDWTICIAARFWRPHGGKGGRFEITVTCPIDPGSFRLFVAGRNYLFQQKFSTEARPGEKFPIWAQPFLPSTVKKNFEPEASTYRIYFRRMELDRLFLSEATDKLKGQKLLWDRQFQDYWLQVNSITGFHLGRFLLSGGDKRCVTMSATIEPRIEPLMASIRLFERVLDVLFPPM